MTATKLARKFVLSRYHITKRSFTREGLKTYFESISSERFFKT